MLLDIHSHIIPYVDDGCRDIDDSIALIKDSYNQGVTDIIATPHHTHHKYEAKAFEIKKNFELLKARLKEENIPVNIYLGHEIHYSHEAISEMLKDEELFSLNNSKVILLEFSYTHEPNDVFEAVYNIQCDGYTVIFAHAERYLWLDIETIQQLKKDGVLFQVNADAILGYEGFKRKHKARKLFKLGLVDYVASDMHWFRPSHLKKALNKLKNPTNINKNIFKI